MQFDMPPIAAVPGCPLANLERRPHLFGAIAAAVGPSALKYGAKALSGGGGKAARKAAKRARRLALAKAGGAVAAGGALFEAGSQVVSAITPGEFFGDQPIVPKNVAGKRMLAQGGGLALTLPLELTAIAKPPAGYVTVIYNGERMFMLKGCARDLGLWKARRKPPISASDWRTLAKASMTAKKVDRLCKMSDKITGKKRTKTVYKKAAPVRRRSR